MFEEVELSTLTKINQAMQLLVVIVKQTTVLVPPIIPPPRTFKFKKVIALSTFAGIDLAINCICGKILFKNS